MPIGTATKTDDGYPIFQGKDFATNQVLPATFTTIAGHQTLDVNSTPMVGGAALSNTNPLPILDGYQNPVSTTWTSATALNTAFSCVTAGYDTVILTLVPSGTITAGAVTFEVFDGVTWLPIKSARVESYYTDQGYSLIGSPAGSRGWQVPVSGFPSFRARLSTAIVGAGSVAVTLITSSAPDTSVITIGLDPGTCMVADGQPALMAGTNSQTFTMSTTGAQGASFAVPVTVGGGSNPIGQSYVDTLGYESLSIQLTSIGAGVGTLAAKCSNDGATWSTALLSAASANVIGSTVSTNTVVYQITPSFRYYQFQLTGAQTSGTTTLALCLKAAGSALATIYTSNGSFSSPSAATSGGCLTYSPVAGWVSGALTVIKGSGGSFYGYDLYNPNASVVYVNFYSVSSITYGTTVPIYTTVIPATSLGKVALSIPALFSTFIYYTVSTSASVLTAPGSALMGTGLYQ